MVYNTKRGIFIPSDLLPSSRSGSAGWIMATVKRLWFNAPNPYIVTQEKHCCCEQMLKHNHLSIQTCLKDFMWKKISKKELSLSKFFFNVWTNVHNFLLRVHRQCCTFQGKQNDKEAMIRWFDYQSNIAVTLWNSYMALTLNNWTRTLKIAVKCIM